MNINKIVKQAQKLQEEAKKIQEQLASLSFEGESGGSKVKATVNGEGVLVKIAIDPSLLETKDSEMIEDLIVVAVQAAQEKAKEASQAQFQKLGSGLGIPGMF
ncbi:nucleoid-associated protein [Methylacidiphilum sp. Yel]|uniref:YbaB/EbfC family nucleoid-associated protein n=1 Tax=Methylacidiphilum sp. Yel TaxID=1847730 RepID=UPI00106D6269|nr:YbaB/EbfC family nucleoid-associated protein [Methylacidiphilum sp. Yel]TFE65490.1 nucleoid-associated protein [Methylacidiphilum sp. Yel]